MLLCAYGLCPAKLINFRPRSFCPLLSRNVHASGKITNALAIAQPNKVLSVFIRSFFADMLEKMSSTIKN